MNYVEEIKKLLDKVDPLLPYVCTPALVDPRFPWWPAAVKKHHGYYGGLAKHTYEVLAGALNSAIGRKADLRVIACGALWHDYGKYTDYKVVPDHDKQELKSIEYCDYASKVGHLSVSFYCFMRAAEDLVGVTGTPDWFNKEFVDAVAHVIISHHGRKEWGSPREPSTLEAVLVHQADVASVMMECGENPALRNITEAQIKVSTYKAEDLSPGDVITGFLPTDKAGLFQSEFVRLDINRCPVVRRLVANQYGPDKLEKVPIRCITYIRPPDDTTKDQG